MKLLMIALIVAVSGGCARLFTASTTASYSGPDGRLIEYQSDKEQIGLEAVYVVDEQGRVREVRIKVDKASTQAEVIQAVLQQQRQLSETLSSLLPLLTRAGAAAAP